MTARPPLDVRTSPLPGATTSPDPGAANPALAAPVLVTKLYRPPPRPGAVPRPRLTGRLDAGLHRRLTLVAAPPALARPRGSAPGSPGAGDRPPGCR